MIGSHGRRFAFFAALAAALLAGARVASAQAPAALLLGDVVARESGTPLAHAMVTVVGFERQTFTSEAGVFAFRGLEPGKYKFRVAHIGYSPVDFPVEITAGTPPPRVKIELAHLSVQLATMKIVGKKSCTTPGRPNPDVEPDFAQIVAQVRMNAEQYRLLSDSFPFQYKVEKEFYSMRGDSSRHDESFETESYRSDVSGWEYKVGDVIGRGRDGRMVMHLPTLTDFASYEFLNNHCFTYGGVESTREGQVVRIDFAADVQLRVPDVNGSVFLDAKTYQIRRANLQLSKIPRDAPEATAIQVTTIFGEVSPSIDIIQQIRGITSVRHRGWGATVANGEDQHMVGLEWLKSDPAHPRVQP